jgi:hypothetical protein
MQLTISKTVPYASALMALFLFGPGARTQAISQFQITGVSVVYDGSEVPLESTVGTSQLKKSGLLELSIKNHVTQYLAIAGEMAGVRLRQSVNTQVFLVRHSGAIPENPSLNTNLAVLVPELRLLVRKKGERDFIMSSVTGTLLGAKSHDPSPKVMVNVTWQDDFTFRVSPQLPLLPGEYAFNTGETVTDTTPQRYAVPTASQAFKLYCFGVN